MSDVVVSDHPEHERYELHVDGELAGFADYRGTHGPTRALTHTEIDPAFEGRGLGTRLIAGVLDDLRAKHLHVVPICPFVTAYLAEPEHAGHLELVEPRLRAAFNLPPGDAA